MHAIVAKENTFLLRFFFSSWRANRLENVKESAFKDGLIYWSRIREMLFFKYANRGTERMCFS